MKLANASDRIHAAGGEVIAVSIDSDERQAAMFARWPTPHVQYVSDSNREILEQINMVDPDDERGIALPGLFVLDPEGNEVFAYRGRDFADRINDDDALDALDALNLGSIDPPAGGPVDPAVDVNQKSAFTPKLFGPYFAGNRFGAIAIGGRAEGDEAKSLAREHRKMAESMIAAWGELNA